MRKPKLSPNYLLVICAIVTYFAISRPGVADAAEQTEEQKAQIEREFIEASTTAQSFIGQYETIRGVSKSELHALVDALCKTDDSQFESVSSAALSRLQGNIGNMYNQLESDQRQAIEELDKIIADSKFADWHRAAQEQKNRVNEVWGRIQKMTDTIRGGNHPVVAYMRDAGQKAHQAYQASHSSECTVGEYIVKERKTDCISAGQCWFIEVKTNTSDAYSKGKQQAREVADVLNTDFDEFKRLTDANANFKNCWRKQFSPKVASYVFCPSIDDSDLSFRPTEYGWGTPQD